MGTEDTLLMLLILRLEVAFDFGVVPVDPNKLEITLTEHSKRKRAFVAVLWHKGDTLDIVSSDVGTVEIVDVKQSLLGD